MSETDFPFAICLTNTKCWMLTEKDFKFMIELEPEGCFILLSNSERIGITTNISFNKIGWLGNLIISEANRRRGAGSLLVEHSVSYLKTKKVSTVGLYSYLDTVLFYRSLGFDLDSEFVVLKGRGFHSAITNKIRRAGKDTQDIINYDCSCFGASRRKLLEPILLDSANFGYVYIQNGQVLGYVVAKVYNGMSEIGPLGCKRSDVAINLIKTVLNELVGFEVYMCIQAKEAAILSILMKSGFVEIFRVARMFLGPHVVNDCIYFAESLERG